MSETRAVIVDDETFNRGLIKTLLSLYGPHYQVVGEAASLREANSVIFATKPDVVFLDIKMPDGSGFDLLKRLPERQFEVIFVTGFDEYALAAFEHNALDYILKPIDIDKFKSTLDRIDQRLRARRENPVPRMVTKIPLHYADKVLLLDASEIMYVSQVGGKTHFTMSTGEVHVSTRAVRDFELLLEGLREYLFISDSVVINLNHVTSYIKMPEYKVVMRDNHSFPINSQARAEIVRAIELSLRI